MIQVTDDLSIPENEVNFTASRSGGPGGQNVNKVSTRVTLSFDVVNSSVLSEDQRKRIMAALGGRINKEGLLRIASQRTRSQEMNRVDVIARFAELLAQALAPRKSRIRTRITQAAHEQRLDRKKKRTAIKQQRSQKDWDA